MNKGFCAAPRQMDEVRVRQCIANVISNAIRHSGADLIVVACGEAEGDDVSITIADDGRGVPEDRRDEIFTPFGSKGFEGAAEGHGAGLGLALSRSMARAMGGDLTLSNDSDGGSIFALRFHAPLI